jgi:hypothetical protein
LREILRRATIFSMKHDVQMTQAEADAYMEQFKQNLGKVLSVSKGDMLKAEALAKKKRRSRKSA